MTWAIHQPFRQDHLPALPVNLLARIGFYSYSIYLWHWIVIFYLLPNFWMRCIKTGSPIPWSSAMEAGQWWLAITVCILVGIAAAMIVEQPGLRLRDRWFPSRTCQPRALAAASGA